MWRLAGRGSPVAPPTRSRSPLSPATRRRPAAADRALRSVAALAGVLLAVSLAAGGRAEGADTGGEVEVAERAPRVTAPSDPPPSPTSTTTAPPPPTTAPPPTTTTALPSIYERLATIRHCESRGDYTALSPTGRFRGGYQFARSTWDAVAAHAGRAELVGVDPAMARPRDQDALAAHLLDRLPDGGPAHWPECGRGVPRG